VLVNAAVDLCEFAIIDTQHDRNRSGEEVLAKVLERRSFERSDHAEPEVICHARGTVALCPNVRTIIDFGGQDAKLISINADGTKPAPY